MSLLRRLIEEPQRQQSGPRYLGVPVDEEVFRKHIIFYNMLRDKGYGLTHHGYVWRPSDDREHFISPFLLIIDYSLYSRFAREGEFDGRIVYADSGIVERMSGVINEFGVDLYEQGLDTLGASWTDETVPLLREADFAGRITARRLAGLINPSGAYHGVVVDAEADYSTERTRFEFPRNQGSFYMEAIPDRPSFIQQLIDALEGR